jgi:hypothetical protein
MVTEVYHPETNGVANQCRKLISAFDHKVTLEIIWIGL